MGARRSCGQPAGAMRPTCKKCKQAQEARRVAADAAVYQPLDPMSDCRPTVDLYRRDPHLATKRSGTSIRGEHVNRGGNKRLKNDLFLAACTSLAPTPQVGPTTTAREPRARNTTPPSSAWPAARPTSCSP